jgi:hypothetical protein
MRLHRNRRSALFLLGIAVLIGLLVASSFLPRSYEKTTLDWLDYWLNRFQTLVSGVLAIVAGAFALVAAKKSIDYDKVKQNAAAEADRRGALLSIEKVISYTSRALYSKHLSISISRYFPMDCFPTCLLDVEPVERIIFDNLKSLPSPMAMKCLFLVYAMKLHKVAFKIWQWLRINQPSPHSFRILRPSSIL